MSLTTLKELLNRAVQAHCAIPAFWGGDVVSSEAALLAAEELGVPVILLVHPSASRLMGRDYEGYMHMLKGMAEHAGIPATIILDHGKNFEQCMQTIHWGIPSVMFDGSSLPHEENIAATREVVRAAHACGVSVEAEIGHVGGNEGTADEGIAKPEFYTDPDDAAMFAEATGIDALAVSIGTVHGIYRGTPKLDIERLHSIRQRVGELPLVMHGGSGLPDEAFEQAVAGGINKINFVTGMMLDANRAIAREIEAHAGKKFTFINSTNVAREEMIRVALAQFKLFHTTALSNR